MRIFKNKFVKKFAQKQNISDDDLISAIQRAESGLIDADLGGGVIKQRIPRQGQGKSGGYRSIILFKSGDKAFFMFVFAKNEQENIGIQELQAMKAAAEVMLAMNDESIQAAIDNQTLTEITP